MSNPWLASWLEADVRLRILSFAGCLFLLFLLLWFFCLQPVRQKSQWLDRQIQQQSRHHQQQLRALLALPSLSGLEQQIGELTTQRGTEQGEAFSLPALLTASGGELEYWQPEARGGELVLYLRWRQFIDLLGYLTTIKPVMTLSGLTLEGQSPRLRLLMTLHDDA